MKTAFFILSGLICTSVCSQVSVNNSGASPHTSAMLEVVSPPGNPKGFLPPKMFKSDRNAIVNPAIGLLVYQTGDSSGYYFYDGFDWKMLTNANSGWSLTGNAGLGLSNNFVGTLDDAPLRFRQNNLSSGMIKGELKQTFFGSNTAVSPGGSFNTAYGTGALKNVQSGGNNIAIGVAALGTLDQEVGNIAIGDSAMYNFSSSVVAHAANTVLGYKAFKDPATGLSNTLVGAFIMEKANGDRRFNTGMGDGAMGEGTGGDQNVAIGYRALEKVALGNKNVAMGTEAAVGITTGSNNVAVGHRALFSQTTPGRTVAVGDSALASFSSTLFGFPANTAIGYQAMSNVTNGVSNTAMGYQAMQNLASDSRYNVAVGMYAMSEGAANDYNTAMGYNAMNVATGAQNVAIGANALSLAAGGDNNTAVGYRSLYSNTASGNTAVGHQALDATTSGFNNTAVGKDALGGNTIGELNVAVGYSAGSIINAGKWNTFLGYDADAAFTDLINASAIGYNARVYASNTMSFGNTSVTSWAFGMNAAPVAGRALQVGIAGNPGNGAYLTDGGTWTNASDKNLKEDFQEVNGSELLEKIAQLPITRWKYKHTNEYHIGPAAQDFKALFDLGNDDKSISTIDPSGLALAAIKELIIQNQKLQEEIGWLKRKLENKR